MFKKLSVVMLAASMLVGCNKNKVEVKEGVKIQFHSHDDKARKLKDGDIVSFLIKIKTGSDSLLQEQVDASKPARDMIAAAGQDGYKGSLRDGLRLLSLGDSATIYVPVDSIGKSGQQLPPFLKKGTDIKYTVKILKVQTKAEFDKDMAVEQAKVKASAETRKAQLPQLMADYVKKSGMTFKTTASGLQYAVKTEGTGDSPKNGDVCKCNYVGKFLDGKIFDQNKNMDMPIGGMIPGFNEALMMMKKGGKATFLIPPAIGYGEQGQGPIPGNSPLVFEVELLDFKKGQ
ncbi:MAG: FKBP-type peptidyl-prolyl cis-trans isomerase [Arcicella sp.]|nr:FKBP-type peptidyl-prolyl cis-trans isomerase [Arcicella sp.]